MNIEIPPTARVVQYQKPQGLDEAIRVTLEVSGAEWRAFTSGLHIMDEDLTPEHAVYLPGSSGDWWNPGSVPGLVAIQIVLPNTGGSQHQGGPPRPCSGGRLSLLPPDVEGRPPRSGPAHLLYAP